MIEPLPEDLARLFSTERALPPTDAARQAAVRARVWKTLGFGGPAPSGGGFGGGAAGLIAAAVVVAAAVGAAVAIAHHRSPPANSLAPAPAPTSASATNALAAAADPRAHAATLRAGSSSRPFAQSSLATPSSGDAIAAATDWMGQLDVPPRAIGGIVTFAGKPLPGADVTLASASTGTGGAPLLHVVSDGDGRFAFAEQPAWSYTLVAEHAGMTAATAAVDLRIPGVGSDVALALTECATRVRGSIRGALGGAVGDARVTAIASPWHGAHASTDANGDFALCVAPGRVRLRFAADGFGTVDRVVDVGAGGTTVDVVLAPDNAVVGTVVGPDGKPRAGAQVGLWHDAANANGADAHAVSDGEGAFEIRGVAAGVYGVTAWTRDAVAWSPYRVAVVDGLIEPLQLRLDATARISGFVVRDGRRLAGADVVASRDGSAEVRSHHARSQGDGSFTLNGVPVGDVALLVDGRAVVPSLRVGADGVSGLYVDAAGP